MASELATLTWGEFKALVDRRLAELGCGDETPIKYIDWSAAHAFFTPPETKDDAVRVGIYQHSGEFWVLP